MLLIIAIHLFLAVVLFFLVNFIGHHTPSSLNYYQLSTFKEVEESIGFNYIIRVLTPTVYLVIISSIFYSFGQDKFVGNLYLVSIYYVSIRFLFIIITNRIKLVNWSRYTFYSLSIIIISYFTYAKLIKTKTNILPDFNNLANELWIIIIIFLYNIINNIQLSDRNAKKRQEEYLISRYNSVRKKFGGIISTETNNIRLQQIAYALIIFESFNRPKPFRIVEYIRFWLSGKPHTLGIMQVMTNKFIGDFESVKLGVRKLVTDYIELKNSFVFRTEEYGPIEYQDRNHQELLIEKYNSGSNYSYEVLTLTDEISLEFYDGANNLFSEEPSFPE